MKKGNEPLGTLAELIRAYHSLLLNLSILHLLPDVYLTLPDVKIYEDSRAEFKKWGDLRVRGGFAKNQLSRGRLFLST